MQRHKWLSLHRCNGTNGCRCTDATAQMAVDAQMQRHKWLSMHRCNGTNGCRCTDAAAQMAVDAQMQRPKRPQTQGCVIVLAQSFARCETNRASTIRQPRPTSTTTNRHSPAFFGAGGRTRTVRVVQGCTMAVAQSRRKDAPTQTTANARMRDSACPKFRTMRNQQSKHDSTTPPHFRQLNSGVLFLVMGRRDGGVTIPPSWRQKSLQY